jgi:hypothetical protein
MELEKIKKEDIIIDGDTLTLMINTQQFYDEFGTYERFLEQKLKIIEGFENYSEEDKAEIIDNIEDKWVSYFWQNVQYAVDDAVSELLDDDKELSNYYLSGIEENKLEFYEC